MSIDIIGYGRTVKDYLCVIDEMPAKNSATTALAMSSQCGGKVSSAMAASARLGVSSAMTGVVGGDYNGRFVRDDFIRHGVDVSRLVVDEAGENVYCWGIATLVDQARIFIGRPGTTRPYRVSDIDEGFLKQAKVLHLESGDEVAREIARIAKKHGILTAIDADSFRPGMEAMEDEIDLFIASEMYYKARAKDGMSAQDFCLRLSEKGARVAMVTLGERGCVGIAEGTPFSLPAYTNVQVTDTTGAGDVFHGAFLAAFVKGHGFIESARIASAVSAIKCTRIGGRAGIPTWDMAIHFMETGEIINTEELDNRVAFYANPDR